MKNLLQFLLKSVTFFFATNQQTKHQTSRPINKCCVLLYRAMNFIFKFWVRKSHLASIPSWSLLTADGDLILPLIMENSPGSWILRRPKQNKSSLRRRMKGRQKSLCWLFWETSFACLWNTIPRIDAKNTLKPIPCGVLWNCWKPKALIVRACHEH